MKKGIALVLALVMMMSFTSIIATAATAATEAGFKFVTPENIYEGQTFEVGLEVSGMTKYGGGAIGFTYDASVVELCNKDGNAVTTLADGIKSALTDDAKYKAYAPTWSAGAIWYNAMIESMEDTNYTVSNPFTFATFYFKAKKAGDAKFAMNAENTEITVDSADTTPANVTPAAQTIVVKEMPNKPTLDGDVTIDGTVAFGETVSAKYTFNNGNKSGTTTDADASKITWTVAGEVVKTATADEDKTLKIDNTDWVAEKVAVKVEPIADRAANLNAVGSAESAKTSAESTIAVAKDYKPAGTLEEFDVKAGKEVPELTLVPTIIYKNSDISIKADSVKWYVLADKADKLETALAPVEGVVTIPDDAVGKFAVATYTLVDDIADPAIESELITTEAIEIEAASSSAPSRDNAPSLAPSKPADKPADEDPTDKPEDPTDKPEDPTDKPADPSTDDPAGTEGTGAEKFTDIPADKYAWAIENIDTLAKAGIIKGMTETTFEPEAKMTVAQFTAMVVRALALEVKEGAADTKLVDAAHWSFKEINIADSYGMLALFEGKLDPDAEIVRDQMFTIAYAGIKAKGIELKADAEAIDYTDKASIGAYATEAVEALTKAGITNGMGDGTLAPKGTTTRAQGAKVIGIIYGLTK